MPSTRTSGLRLGAVWAAALSVIGLHVATAAADPGPPINTLRNSPLGGHSEAAIDGYDTVAYFTQGRPVRGQATLATQWMGATWRFSTQAHLDLFKADPERYAPQYGGYCAYGVSQNYLVKVDPEQFTVRGGKLYLNYDAGVQARWSKDPAGYIGKADGRFVELIRR